MAPAPPPPQHRVVAQQKEGIPPETIEKLSTFDKGDRSNATVSHRLSVFDSRVRRSKEKVQATPPIVLAQATVDDSLLVDAVGSTARDYERHAHYKGSTRAVSTTTPLSKRERPEEEEEDDEDDDDEEDVVNMEIDDGDIYLDGDEEAEEPIGKTLLVPLQAVPETGNRKTITTFSELVGPNPATKQFESNMRHVKGPEQHMFVEVRPQEVIYKHVTTTLNNPLHNQQLLRYAVKNGLTIPKLPIVSKATVQDGLCAPDFSIGERPCVYGVKCESFVLCIKAKKKYPEKYAGVEAFACKEFYFGVRGEKVREAIAQGLSLHEVLNPEPVMCVMCHLAIVSRFYKRYSLGLELDPPHILHSFEMIADVEGQYPSEMMLLGDDKFMGIIAPYLRFCPDNYAWNPRPPMTVEEEDPITHITQRMTRASIQCWTELPVLDFHEGAVSRFGRLYPQRPYSVQINTFHVPSVESTLLRTFQRGTSFVRTAPVVFQDSVADTIRYLDLGVHIDVDHDKLCDFVPCGLETVNLTIAPQNVIWTPRCTQALQLHPAHHYKVLIATYLRVNGASQLFAMMRKEHKKGQMPKGDVIGIKVREFIDQHVQLAMYLDSVDDPRDDALDQQLLRSLGKSRGPTDYAEDRGFIRVEQETIALEETPLEILSRSLPGVEMFQLPTEAALGQIAHGIRCVDTDETLVHLYVCDEAHAFDYYYPVRMKTPEECRLHSWYLACLVMINRTYGLMEEPADIEDDDKSGDDEDEEERDEYLHSTKVRHALHRVMGSFVPLFFHALLESKLSDEDWRPKPADGRPTVFDKYFPCDTACFHAGDLPNLSCLIDQVGMYGVQNVKTKIPLVRMLIKSLPVCCQGRDLVKCFIAECRAANGEGYWRVVRSFFWCTMCGLYPHCKKRVDFRSMMRVYDLLFQDKDAFFRALEKEIIHNKGKPKDERTNKMCKFVYAVFREFFIHSTSSDSEWIAIVNHRIAWPRFVAHTFEAADEMRQCARFADAPKGGDELLFAVNALCRCKGDYTDVYRYRKKEYVPTIIDKMNKTQDTLNNKKRLEIEEIRLAQRLMGALVANGVLTDEEVEPLLRSRHAGPIFNNDPMAANVTHEGLEAALKDSLERYADLQYTVDPQVKVNIMNFLLRTPPTEWLQFDSLLDPRLGAVSRESIQTMAKTHTIYMTRSSPKSIQTHVQNLDVRDLRLFSWYFNIMARLEKFNLIPLYEDFVTAQARALRKHRFQLLDDEPLPPGAWTVYVCFCCGRIASYCDTATYGNFGLSYDPRTRNMVCSKKVARTTRVRHKAAEPASVTESNVEKKKREDSARTKKAKTERKDDNFLPCEGQPALPVNLYGMALEFGGERYLFCPCCGQFHMYRDKGWGRRGYRCKQCRDKENPLKRTQHCAHCDDTSQQDLKVLDIIALDDDPCNPHHDIRNNPLSCYQTLCFCQKDANSAGLFASHGGERYYANLPKDMLWPKIAPAGTARAIKHDRKHN